MSKVWKLRFNIDPILIYFGEQDLDQTYGTVKYIKPIDGVDLYLQSQWARIWFTSEESETTFIVSDIDMFPISKSFFIDQLYEIDDDKYVHLRGDVNPLPICYHVAKGKKFKQILNLPSSFEKSLYELINSNNFFNHHMNYNKWGLDEFYSTQKIMKYKDQSEIKLLQNRSMIRLDRSNWPTNYYIDHYVDCHSIRPVSQFKNELNVLVDKLLC